MVKLLVWLLLIISCVSLRVSCPQVVVRLSDELLSQAVMMVESCRPTLTINLAGARQHWLEGMLRHEIGTQQHLTLLLTVKTGTIDINFIISKQSLLRDYCPVYT